MTEAIFAAVLHQDPRYFRRGSCGEWSRLGYAIGQTFWTHSDSGRMQFNYSEILCNSTAVAISNAYYQDNRDAANALTKLGTQIGVDLAAARKQVKLRLFSARAKPVRPEPKHDEDQSE